MPDPMTERERALFVSDRERLEASASQATLNLADAFATELERLGHDDLARRRALLLNLASIASMPQSEEVGGRDVAALLEGTTPGPWGVEPTETRLWIGPMRANSAKVADIVAPIEWGNNYRDDYLIKQAANADLIAAAPRLAAEHIALTKKVDELEAEIARKDALLNTPEVDDFAKGAVLEAAHQRARWPSEHDAGKSAFDWFWLIGYLAQKAAAAQLAGDRSKALHHTISTAAALANWHLAISGTDTAMRPGIEPPALREEPDV